MRFPRRLVLGSAALAMFPLLASSCASVPASQVRVVRHSEDVRIGPLEMCGYMGTVETAMSDDVEKARQELRESAGRRGANTVVISPNPGLLHGKAYLCPAPGPNRSSLAANWERGTASYGPDVPQVQRYPPGATDIPANPLR
jgi:hypothetical protein